MNSIRQRLIVALVACLAVVLAAGGAGVYFFTRTTLHRDFDRMLRASAPEILTMVNQILLEQFGQEKEVLFDVRRNPPLYVQVWSADGHVLGRSIYPGRADFPFPALGTKNEVLLDLVLPDQRQLRALVSKGPLVALSHTDNRRDSGGVDPGVKNGREPQTSEWQRRVERMPKSLVILIAADRAEVTAALARLSLVLWLVGGAVLVLAALAITLITRRGLAPLHQVADQAGSIDAHKLDFRFPTGRMPQELRTICERLNDLLARLESAFARERRFSADVAHELRTPIAELRSLAEVALKWPGPDPAATSAFAEAREIALQMQAIANGLLAIARCEAGTQVVMREPVLVAEFARKAWLPFAAQAAQKNLNVQIDLPELEPIEADPGMLGVILSNLFSNAVEYTGPAGAVQICLLRDAACLDLRVSNSAPCLQSEDLPHLFERFWRKDKARSSSEHSGIGLSVAQAFARTLGLKLHATLSSDGLLTMRLCATDAKSL